MPIERSRKRVKEARRAAHKERKHSRKLVKAIKYIDTHVPIEGASYEVNLAVNILWDEIAKLTNRDPVDLS